MRSFRTSSLPVVCPKMDGGPIPIAEMSPVAASNDRITWGTGRWDGPLRTLAEFSRSNTVAWQQQ